MIQPLPCPCGGKPQILSDPPRVKCPKCGKSEGGVSQELAVTAWNWQYRAKR